MKNHGSGTLLKYSVILIFTASFLFVSACKKEDSKTEEPPKTLTKSHILDKEWFNSGPTISHKFNSNGTYYNIGTWAWLNNSDSMEVKITSSGSRLVWYFEWSTEHEFSAKPSKNSGYILFKDQVW